MIWKLVALLLARPAVTDWLIRRAQRTPYQHITSADGSSVYMGRWWLFNPYPSPYGGQPQDHYRAWLPSIRVHHICRADQDRDLHDHPWNARTFILRGWYTEEREWSVLTDEEALDADGVGLNSPERAMFHRLPGYTGRLLFGQYHRISKVSDGGVWTVFVTGRKRGTWGFMVNGAKVPWRTYLGLDDQQGGAA